MATYTPNYNLIKPALEDFADVEQFNQNMDIIDEGLAGAAKGLIQLREMLGSRFVCYPLTDETGQILTTETGEPIELYYQIPYDNAELIARLFEMLFTRVVRFPLKDELGREITTQSGEAIELCYKIAAE